MKIMIRLDFWKMHGLGNDFIIIDNRDRKLDRLNLGKLASTLCRRRFSIGADGLLLLYKSNVADAKMRIFNADGSEAEMCGNGIRCIARYCYERNIARKEHIRIETLAGTKDLWLKINDGRIESVKVDMGSPKFKRPQIPMRGEGTFINQELKVNGEKFRATCLSIGNPHCVIFIDKLDEFPVRKIGSKIERHELFPNRVNVEFVEVMSRNELKVRVWERGVGETLACGTGACASVVAGKINEKTDRRCTVHLLGGDLKIEYTKDNKIFMEGSVEKVYEGIVFLEV